MKIKRIIIAIFSVLGVATLIFTIFYPNEKSESVNSKNKVYAAINTEEPLKNMHKEDAQKLVNFKLVTPSAPDGFEEPTISVLMPPENAIKTEEGTRKNTRIEIYYNSKNAKNEGIVITKVSSQLIPMDATTGKPLDAGSLEVDGLKVNTYECNCTPKVHQFWWYENGVSTQIKVFGEYKEQKIVNLIKQINKK